MKLDDIKKYFINLERRPDRRAQAYEQFDRHKLTVERFQAIDSQDIKLEYGCGNNIAACSMSHYFLIERAHLLGLPAVMIFEDDVQLHPQFCEILEKILADLPENTDMLYLGGSNKEKPINIGHDCILKVVKTLTTHGYIMFRSMFENFLYKTVSMNDPIDCQYVDFQQGKHGQKTIFITNPPLAWQAPGHSDIEGRHMEYPWIKTNDIQ